MEEIEEMIENITNLIENRRICDLREYLENIKSADFPSIFDELDEEKSIMIYRLLSKEKATRVFVELDHDAQEKLIGYLTDIEIKNVMNEIYMDDAADLIEEMPSDIVNRILINTKSENRKIINELLKYPNDTAGSIMTTEFIDLKEDMTVQEAFDYIKEKGIHKETVYNCYVLSKDKKLIGIVDIKTLLVSDTEQLIKEIVDTNVIKVETLDDQEEVTRLFDKYKLIAVPVVDKDNILVGIITIDDAIDVMQEETSEDFALMAGITSTNDDTYFKTSVFKHTKNRILWLLLLMISATITGSILTNFEDAISALPVLVAFIPMLMDTGGNCGSQTSTLIIRGLATDEIKVSDFFKVIWKELRVAILVGLILAVANGIRIAIQYNNPLMAIVVGLTLICIVISAKLIGAILPIAAKKIKLDPALMASPIISTIVDIVAVVIFFKLSVLILHI